MLIRDATGRGSFRRVGVGPAFGPVSGVEADSLVVVIIEVRTLTR
ncbi:hypothetical protein MARA_09340 [Mycolicibacterium arabiense]|uniref:Uncharacterized protein n=1 Tax=Mycolicibacterium arabiense TaxID=1286181 RepID=A0A7I7RTY8_9MYCO|nr:hypothetical protein MARA_09340 [Mycolicibacterium arabiense]